MRTILAIAGALCSMVLSGQESPPEPEGPPPPAATFRPRPLSIGDALRVAFYANPDLLNSEDLLLSARINELSVRSNYLPQVTPFYAALHSSSSGVQSQAYGVRATQQFSFGPLIEASAVVTRAPPDFPDYLYGSDYIVSLTQPLLRGADPVVTREPLHLAERLTTTGGRALEVQRRQTILLIYQLYLGLAQEQDAVHIAADRLEQARKLTQFSHARFLAGGVSRLDVLRSEQQEASASVERNDATNLAFDLRDQLRRAAGLRPDYDFTISAPERLPGGGPSEAQALEGVASRRPEALEAADRVKDAELAVRIAKSLQLPSLDGVLSYEAIGNGGNVGSSFPIKSSSFLFGFRSEYGLNTTALYAQRRQAEIDLEVRKRDYQLLLDDLARDVQQAYRRLETARSNNAVAVENLKVAELQVKVARLRFEKGLSGNFDAVDADNLLNSARLLELSSRFNILLAELDCLYRSGYLNVSEFLEQP